MAIDTFIKRYSNIYIILKVEDIGIIGIYSSKIWCINRGEDRHSYI